MDEFIETFNAISPDLQIISKEKVEGSLLGYGLNFDDGSWGEAEMFNGEDGSVVAIEFYCDTVAACRSVFKTWCQIRHSDEFSLEKVEELAVKIFDEDDRSQGLEESFIWVYSNMHNKGRNKLWLD